MQREEQRNIEKLHEAEELDYNKRLAAVAQDGEMRAREEKILEKVQRLINKSKRIQYSVFDELSSRFRN